MIRVLLILLVAALSYAGPQICYTKTFPGSVPAYVEIVLEKDGTAVYKDDPKDEAPGRFQLKPEETKQIFDLADKLDHFKKPLESGLKVANMGKKQYKFIDGSQTFEVEYNHSQDENAQKLQDWFERITDSQQIYYDLERTVKFDKLGVNKSLLRLQSSLDHDRLVNPERFLPLLDRVVKNESYLHMARERAAAMADSIRSPKPKPSE